MHHVRVGRGLEAGASETFPTLGVFGGPEGQGRDAVSPYHRNRYEMDVAVTPFRFVFGIIDRVKDAFIGGEWKDG